MTNQRAKLSPFSTVRVGLECLVASSFFWVAAVTAATNSEMAGLYETGPTDGMVWAYSIKLRVDGNASLVEPHPLPDGDGTTLKMQGTWQVNGQKINATFPGKLARSYEFKVNPKLKWDESSECKPRKGSSFGLELVKAEESTAGKIYLVETWYRLWRVGDPKWDARKCSGG